MAVTVTRLSDTDRKRALAEAPMGNEPKMLFYDAAGHRTSEDQAVVQYLSDDPNRPDAKKDEDKSVDAPTSIKAVTAPPATTAAKKPAAKK